MACNNLALSGISLDCTASMGGIKKAWMIPHESGNFTVSGGEITDIDGTWKAYNFRKNTGSFTSTLNVDGANGTNYVSTEITLQFTKMETNKRLEIATLALGEVDVIVQDSNNEYWGFGVEEPVTVTSGTGQTGTAKGDGNFYQIVLTDEQSSFPMHLTASAIASLVGGNVSDPFK